MKRNHVSVEHKTSYPITGAVAVGITTETDPEPAGAVPVQPEDAGDGKEGPLVVQA